MPTITEPLRLLGAAGSPYTRKMLALMRYRRIPYAVHWGSHRQGGSGLPAPKVQLLPTFYFPVAGGALEAVVDSTPIIRRLEEMHTTRSAIPADPAMSFIDALIEDYADEWLTKAMFHYRWAHAADAANAGPLLIFWSDPTLPDDQAATASAAISQRQIDRLYVVGSNAVTGATIEASYLRFVTAFDRIVQHQGYAMGRRPGASDFAIFGQMTQLALVEPTSGAETSRRSRRLVAWVHRLEDLSGLDPNDADWLAADAARDVLGPLLDEIGRVHAPFLIANAQAAQAGKADLETEIDGRRWTQPVFPYQVRCLEALRSGFAALGNPDQARVRAILANTGCERLLPA
jgi:glutathione S-transferase